MYKTARLCSSGLSWKEFGKKLNRSQCRSRILCQVNLFNRSLSTESAQKTLSSKNNDQQHSNNEREFDSTGYAVTTKLCFALGITGSVIWLLNRKRNIVHAAQSESAGSLKKGLPTYSLEEVAKHNKKENRIWVTYKNGVYDITDYVSNHPGGSRILLAAGSSIEPYWEMYAAHKQEEIYEMLEELRIGNITEKSKDEQKDSSDPYANDPKRHVALKPSSSKPFNAEPPLSLLRHSYLTPNDLFFVRNHLPVPVIDPKKYQLTVTKVGSTKQVNLSLEDLKRKFNKKSVVSIVQCAGNRRSEMVTIKPVKGLNWGAAAISNASWAGACLDDVLKRSGIDIETVDAKHIIFDGADADPTGHNYGASIPIEMARLLKKDIILAYEMNGKDIPPDHGYPVRVIIPGVVGARQVKWLNKITLSDKESTCHWQQKDYKGFHSSIDWHNVDFTSVPPIYELPVQSVICEPEAGSVLEDEEEVTVKGYAWSGGGRGIVRVDLSADGGKTWHSAELSPTEQPLYKTYAWTFWEGTIPLPKDHKGEVEIVCKAADTAYNVQPDNVEGIWNLRGVLSNAWHRVPVKVPKS